MRDPLFGFAWLFLLPLSLYSAHLGVMLWIWVALISPNELLYSFLSGIPFNKLVAISAIALLVLGKDKARFYRDPLLILIAAFGALFVTSYLAQEYPNPFSDTVFDRFWKEIALAVMITGVMHTQHRLHQAALATALGFGFMSVKEALIFMFTGGGHTITGTSGTGDNNGLALAVLMTIPVLLYCARQSAVHWVRLVIQVTAGLGAVTVLATFSRGGFVGLVLLALLLMGGSKRKLQTIIVIGVFAVIAYQLLPAEYFQRVDTIKEASEDDSFTVRLVAWKVNYLMALDHPLLGGGPYASLAWQNWSRYIFETTTFLFPTPVISRTYVAHSIYFQVLGDTGFPGLILFIAVLGVAIGMARRTRRLARQDSSLAWAADLARATEVSLIVYCVSGAALSLPYFELLYILLAIVSRTHRTVVEQLAARPVPARGRVSARLALSPSHARVPALRQAT